MVEFLTALVFAAIVYKYGYQWVTLEYLIFAWALIVCSFIDFDHYILPDVFTLTGILIGLTGAALNPERSFYSALWGVLLGGGFLYAIAYTYLVLRKEEGMGGGDIKLLAWIGAVLGWTSVPFVILVSSVLGSLVGLGLALRRETGLKSVIPFGPYLALAALLYIFGGEAIGLWYIGLFLPSASRYIDNFCHPFRILVGYQRFDATKGNIGMFFFQSKKLIGLDIGTANLKMAEVEVSRKGSTLTNFVIMPTPARAISGGEISDPAAISEALKTMILNLKTKRKSIATGLWGTSVITKRITVPMMDEKLVGGQIRWEAEQYIPFDINEVNIDFKILKSFQSSPENLDILLVAARQDVAFLYQDIVQSAGLNCSVIDVSGFSLANCFLNGWGSQKGQTVALMNIGAAVTNFVVIENGEVIFCRDIPVGGLTYTSEINKAMGISLEDAESMKISACTGQAAPEEVGRIIQASHEVLAEEVQNSLDFFVNTTPGLPVQQCLVTGGASRTTGLINYLSEHTKMGFQIFDPFRNVKMNDRLLNPDYVSEVRDFASIAMGLGLRATGDAS